MLDTTILYQVKLLKDTLQSDGFIIDGIFGSFARGENKEGSDVDILYHLENRFFEQNSGFAGFKKLQDIKDYMSKILDKKVDIAPKNNLSNTAKRYILSDVIYV